MAQRVNIEVLNKAAVDVTVQNSNAINVEAPTAPRDFVPRFTADKTEIQQGQRVDFSSSEAGFQYYWEIEDVGGFVFKNAKNVTHQFIRAGNFDVALTQSDLTQQTSGIQVKRDFIKVNETDTLLDRFFAVGATAAYSLRRLKSTATKAVRVREDIANTETDIGFVGIELDTTALLNHCGSANGFVTKWYDQSGNGNDASNSTAAEQPKLYDSSSGLVTENGRPALDALGSTNAVLKANIDIGSTFNFAMFTAAGFNDTVKFPGLWGIEADNRLASFKENDDFQFDAAGSTRFGGQPTRQENFVSSMLFNSGTAKLRVNQIEDTQTANNQITGINNSTLFLGNRPSNDPWRGYMQEFIFYFNDKEASINKFENNINSFYSIF